MDRRNFLKTGGLAMLGTLAGRSGQEGWYGCCNDTLWGG